MTLAEIGAFSKDSTNIFFHILTQCNLKCRHCYIHPQQHEHNTLPLAAIVSWLQGFSADSYTLDCLQSAHPTNGTCL